MSPARLTLSIAAGIVLGGLGLCAAGTFFVGLGSRSSDKRTEKRFDERDHLRSAAKMIGLAALLYSSDFGDMLPSAPDFKEKIAPYLFRRDQSAAFQDDLSTMLRRFEIAYAGDTVTKPANPSNTPLGWITGTDGYAVVYLDGSAEWRVRRSETPLPGAPK